MNANTSTLALPVIFVLVFGGLTGCIFSEGDETPDSGPSSDATDTTDTSDASDVSDVSDVSDASDVSDGSDSSGETDVDEDATGDTEEDSDDDAQTNVSCPEQCELEIEYETEDSSFAPVGNQTFFTLFEPVELRANVTATNGTDLTGCSTQWSGGTRNGRVNFAVRTESGTTTLDPVAVFSPGWTELSATTTCDQGQISATVKPGAEYPEFIPTAGDGGAPAVHWWSTRSFGAVANLAPGTSPWQWWPVEKSSIHIGVNDVDDAPTMIRENDTNRAFELSQDKFLARRNPNDTDGHTQSERNITTMLTLRLDTTPTDEQVIPIVENCQGDNYQFRLRQDLPKPEAVVVFDGVPYSESMTASLLGQTWFTVGLVYADGFVTFYFDGQAQNSQPLDVDPPVANPFWKWDSLLKGCKSGRPDYNIEVGDVLVIDQSLGAAEMDNISKLLLERF